VVNRLHANKYSITSQLFFVVHSCAFYTKQLLDEVFVISRLIKVEVGVISQSQRLKLITLT